MPFSSSRRWQHMEPKQEISAETNHTRAPKMAAIEASSSPNKAIGHFRNQYYAVIAGLFANFNYFSIHFHHSTSKSLQFYSTTANLIVFSHGVLVSWVAPILPLLKSIDTPLTTGPMSVEEISWLVSLGALGSMFAALPIRSMTNRVGCKRMMISYLAVLSIVSGVREQKRKTNSFRDISYSHFHCRFAGL